MTIFSSTYKSHPSKIDDCYRFEIKKHTLKDFLRYWTGEFTTASMNKVQHVTGVDGWILYGYAIFVEGGTPYDEEIPIAISDSLEELKIFSDMHNLNAKVNMSSKI